nr:MAG TPA: hypothetical protein [Caudoviricetes sp.]DAO40589.1 MAG TPA: hypothetical protein [Caudoviricetes sp.]
MPTHRACAKSSANQRPPSIRPSATSSLSTRCREH